ncbi:MAG: hypothetical protein IKO68_07050, partial [Oscillospiraceae bacterium]|nr:hypothetical protein [Oscillospiraceae bacterium]
LLRKDFDLLRSARPTVPLYADGHALLVFRPFWQSASVSKISFSTRSKELPPCEAALLQKAPRIAWGIF